MMNETENNATTENDDDDFMIDPALDAAYEEASVDDLGGGDDLPEGKYQILIADTRMKAFPREGGGKDVQVSFHLKVLGPRLAGRHVWKNMNLNAQGIPWIKKELLVAKFDGMPTSLPNRHQEIRGRVIDITCRHKPKPDGSGHWVHYYFDRLVAMNAEAAGVDPAAAGALKNDAGDVIF